MVKIEEIVIIVVKIRMIKIKDGKIMRILISPMIINANKVCYENRAALITVKSMMMLIAININNNMDITQR